jgi:hypothetical protein
LWLTGSATLRDGAADLALFRVRGQFDAAGSEPESTGSLRLRFSDCERLQIEFDLQLDGERLQGTREMQRLTPDSFCQTFRQLGDGALSALPQPAGASSIHYGSSGTWFEPATSGQGFLFEYLPASQTLAASWYTYDFTDPDTDGSQPPLWLTAVGPVTDDSAELAVTLTRGGAFDTSDPVSQSAVGTLSIRSNGCQSAVADYAITIDGTARSGSIDLQRLTAANLCRTTRLH